MATRILRCTDGHLFSATWLKLVFLSAHFVNMVWLRCPVDRKWRMASRVSPGTLPAADLYEAQQRRF